MDSVDLAVAVPVNVEKIPLFHWKPGTRLLRCGDRDGPSFGHHTDPAADRTFTRTMPLETLRDISKKVDTNGIYHAWCEGLSQPDVLEALLEAALGPMVVATSGYGVDPSPFLARVDAWVLYADAAKPGPWTETILEGARHVEVALGLQGSSDGVPNGLKHAAAIHLLPERPHGLIGADLIAAEQALVGQLTTEVPTYTSENQRTACANCGEILVWRGGGSSRLGALDPNGKSCTACGHPAPINWS